MARTFTPARQYFMDSPELKEVRSTQLTKHGANFGTTVEQAEMLMERKKKTLKVSGVDVLPIFFRGYTGQVVSSDPQILATIRTTTTTLEVQVGSPLFHPPTDKPYPCTVIWIRQMGGRSGDEETINGYAFPFAWASAVKKGYWRGLVKIAGRQHLPPTEHHLEAQIFLAGKGNVKFGEESSGGKYPTWKGYVVDSEGKTLWGRPVITKREPKAFGEPICCELKVGWGKITVPRSFGGPIDYSKTFKDEITSSEEVVREVEYGDGEVAFHGAKFNVLEIGRNFGLPTHREAFTPTEIKTAKKSFSMTFERNDPTATKMFKVYRTMSGLAARQVRSTFVTGARRKELFEIVFIVLENEENGFMAEDADKGDKKPEDGDGRNRSRGRAKAAPKDGDETEGETETPAEPAGDNKPTPEDGDKTPPEVVEEEPQSSGE